ncbi:MAG TPA: SPFH domain-containing protein [Verrucomicrobiae bacterium]|nr:SPFH domain-containing protein [Verrucomicrobiae bacterium]
MDFSVTEQAAQQQGTPVLYWIFLGIIVLAVIAALFSSFFTVEQQHVGIVERFGKFTRLANAGLNFKIPFIEGVASVQSLRIQQLTVEVETTSSDNVFIEIALAVQFMVLPERVKDAYYKLNDPEEQIKAYVSDAVRGKVPHLELSKALQSKTEIADAARAELNESMGPFGFEIVQTLVTDIIPDEEVMKAMNNIVAARRNREAATENGEAAKILQIKAAEAEAESKVLQGKGIAGQRREIVLGLKEAVVDFSNAVPGTSPHEVMALVTTTQYYDTMHAIGANSKNTVLMVPMSANGGTDIMQQILAANAAMAAEQSLKGEATPPQVLAPLSPTVVSVAAEPETVEDEDNDQ